MRNFLRKLLRKNKAYPQSIGKVTTIRVHEDTKRLIEQLMKIRESYEDTIVRVFTKVKKENES